MTSDATEPTIVHLPATVREALSGIAAARGMSVEALVERVLGNAVAAEARWRRFPEVDAPGRRPAGEHRRRAGDRGSAPALPGAGPASADEPRSRCEGGTDPGAG